MQKICVLGLGYIGLPTAAMLATHGFQVVGVDVNQKVIKVLNQGEIHIEEPGLKTLVGAALNSGRLTVQQEPEASDIFVIAVPTPITQDKQADLSYIISATKSIVPIIEIGNLVVLEATSPPRTTIDLVQPILEKSGLRGGKDFLLAYSPERVLPGKILHELVNNSRVIGGIDEKSAQAGKNIYASFVEGEILLTDATTAEMVKLMENTYRDINIAIANEFSRLAAHFGVNIWEAIKIANLHPRVEILKPGPGVGGHCISVDPWFFVEKAPEIAQLIHQARIVNDSQPIFVIQVLQETFESLEGVKLGALGVTYKPDVDDIRESPAIVVIQNLLELGADVRAFDPFVSGKESNLDFMVDELAEACTGAAGLILLVDHKQFQKLDPAKLAGFMEREFILDTRNVIDRDSWQAAGFKVKILGDGQK